MKKIDRTKTQKRAAKLACVFFSSLLLLLSIGLVSGYAEVTLTKSPLSWYEGASGDYALPKLVNAEYVPSGFAATEGQVKTICVNYDATGKVAVEVSADNGLHYYSVVNGVPLTENFVSGDRIRWRAKVLDEEAKLNALNITYTDSAGTIASFGHPELSGFNYRKEILLKNPSGQELFNYQLKLKIGETKEAEGADLDCSANLKKDFTDIRFTAADGETPLPYYLESRGGLNLPYPDSSLRTFWVKVPQIPVNGVAIYLYYGNPDAADLSNPKEVFDFYDNFQNTELDANSWVVKADPKGSCVVKDGQLNLDAAEIITKDFKFKQGVIEYAVSVESGFENSLNLRPKAGDSYDNPGLVVYSSAYKGAEQCIAIDDIVRANDANASPVAAGGKYNYRLTVNDKDITFERFGAVSTTPADSRGGLNLPYIDGADSEVQAKVTYSGTAPIKVGYLGLKSGGDGSGRNIIAYSEVRARKFADNQPQVDKTGVTEQVKLPNFWNIALSKKGSLILNDNKEGVYIGKAIPTEFTARIITPTFKGTNAGAGVSANNGVNYKENCVSASYYYASAKDFAAGTKVVGKIKLTPSTDKSSVSEFTELKLDYNPGTILMVKPNGAETWNAGATEEISWSALDYDSDYPIKLEYSLDSGKNYSIITDKVSNSGAYNWKIPQDLISKAALIRASDSNEASVSDKSDNVFTIQKSAASSQEAVNINQAVEEAPIPIEEVKKEVVQDEAAEVVKVEEEKEAEVKIIDLNKLTEAKQLPSTQLYDLLIKLGDNTLPNNPTEDARACFKEGDIVVVVPAGHNWSETERNSFLIIQAYLTEQEARGLVSPKIIDTGKKDKAGQSIKKLAKIRAKHIDLRKFGLVRGVQERAGKIQEIQSALKDKPIATGMIEQK